MRALLFFALLACQVNAVRKIVDANVAKNLEALSSTAFSELEEKASAIGKELDTALEAAGGSFLSILEMLKEDPNNQTLQSDYSNQVGEVEWDSPEEEASYDPDSLLPESKEGAGAPLGEMSAVGGEYNVVELLDGIKKKLGRLFTYRRDYMIETKEGGSKYILKGKGLSLHSRMHILDQDANPLYVLRRSFAYINPVAAMYGQYSYRVIQCIHTGSKSCKEGDVLYTITKDRLGRGLMWGRDEYRVFVGTGGCKKWSSGLFSCNKDNQILYSISSGASYTYYQGHIHAMSGDKAKMYDGHTADAVELQKDYEVAKSVRVEGPPRVLNWIGRYAKVVQFGSKNNVAAGLAVGTAVGGLSAATGKVFDIYNIGNPNGGFVVAGDLLASMALGSAAGVVSSAALSSTPMAPYAIGISKVTNLAKDLVWNDAYHVNFTKSTDSLLIFVVQAVQDLTNDKRAG